MDKRYLNRMDMPARTRIKICGVRTLADALAAVAAGADAVGLVFVAGSPRHVEVERAREVVAGLPAFVEPVGLFANQTAEAMAEVMRAAGLRTAQLHGREGVEVAAELAERVDGLRVIKAMACDGDLPARLRAWSEVEQLAGVLIDTPAGAGELGGGSGRAFDWDALAGVLDEWDEAMPAVILAGGLDAQNVGRAIQTVQPYAVDVSSGVEAERGVKDVGRIAAFCRAVREADGAKR